MKISNFWNKVNKDTISGCWEWTGATRKSGYGAYKGPNGLVIDVHRFVFNITTKMPIPDGMIVLHSCDNRICCNPAHLSLGTHEENMRDMKMKGRDNYAKGERAGSSKLTDKEVKEIRAKYATGEYTHQSLAEEYGVDKTSVRSIIKFETWKHV